MTVVPASTGPAKGATRRVKVQILKVPGCPNAGPTRALVELVLAGTGVQADIEELEGPYPSPTVLVDSVEVTGRPIGPEASCRLDLPTEQQVLEALGLPADNS